MTHKLKINYSKSLKALKFEKINPNPKMVPCNIKTNLLWIWKPMQYVLQNWQDLLLVWELCTIAKLGNIFLQTYLIKRDGSTPWIMVLWNILLMTIPTKTVTQRNKLLLSNKYERGPQLKKSQCYWFLI